MAASDLSLDPRALAQVLRSDADRVGVLEEVVGLNTATTTIKSVHIMNDLAQQVIGGAPSHRGDFLCRVIRYSKDGSDLDKPEDNSDQAMRADPRFGEAYKQAFPPALGLARTRAIREAAQLLLNHDGGMYCAGDMMASGLASHWTLLGFEGFSRFGLGGALAQVLGEEGRARVGGLFESARDPVTLALRPLMLGGDLTPRTSGRGEFKLRPFDVAYGRRLQVLLAHTLSKPTTLRALALSSVAWTVLRILGAGLPEGRPAILVIPSQWRRLGCRLREPAVQAYASGVARLYDAVATALAEDTGFQAAVDGIRYEGEDAIAVAPEAPAATALSELRSARSTSAAARVYWPDSFAAALGRRVGCVGPKDDRAGWGKYFCFTPDLLEAVILMFSDSEGAPRPWRSLWAEVRTGLGVVIGANPYEDEGLLRDRGLQHLSLDDLEHNSELFLEQACQRGLARRLPDGEAEAGVAIY